MVHCPLFSNGERAYQVRSQRFSRRAAGLQQRAGEIGHARPQRQLLQRRAPLTGSAGLRVDGFGATKLFAE